MDFIERNKKAAIARWTKIQNKEKDKILVGDEANKIKAGICGLLAGDGSVQVRKQGKYIRYDLYLFADDKEMTESYLNFIEKIYSKKPVVFKRYNMLVSRITSKTIVQDLKSISKFGIHTWDLPDSLFSIDGAKEYWLKGFFSAEGYVNPKYIKTQSVNIEGLNKVSNLLNDIGIANRTYVYKPKNPNHSPVGMLFIRPKDARKTFYEKVGFWHSKKERNLKKSLGL